jgi:hypothetical protein
MTTLTPYVAIDDTEITSYLRDGAPRPVKPSKKIKDEPIIGTNRAVLWNEGRGALGYKMECSFLPSQYATYDTVAQKFDGLEDGALFYPRSDRFAVCAFGNSDPLQSREAAEGEMLRLEGQVWSEAAELYSATPSSWSPTDEILPITQAAGEENAGNIEAGLYSLALTARMSGPALKFDGEGSDDYLNCGTPDLSSANDSVSVEMWILAPAVTAEYYPGLCLYGADYTTSGGFTAAINPPTETNNRVYMGFGTGADVVFNYMGELPINVWCHVVFIHDVDAEYDYYYLNGTLVDSVDISGSTPASIAATQAFKTGLRTADTFEMDVTIAHMRVWARTISAGEVEDAYLGETVSDTSLAIEYDFCEGQGATVFDLSGNSNDGTLTDFADTTAGYGDSHDGGWLTSIGPASPALELLGAADAVMDTLTLAPSLMTAEVLEMDRFGQISQTYVATFTADVGRSAFDSGYFWADGYAYAKYIGSEIVLTSLINGRVGEEITITITDTDQASTTVSVSGYDITVDLETDAGTPVATSQEVIDAINGDDDAKLLVLATLAAGEDGSSVIDALGETALALNVNVTGGALVIEDNYEAGYHLPGSHPIVAGGLLVTFTPTLTGTLTGSDVLALEASVDSGATWETVIDSGSVKWTDGEEMEVYVPDSIVRGETEVWIRFVCPASATSLSIDDLTIYQERHVSDSEVPKIPVGSTYKVQIGGAGWGDAATVWRNRYKP